MTLSAGPLWVNKSPQAERRMSSLHFDRGGDFFGAVRGFLGLSMYLRPKGETGGIFCGSGQNNKITSVPPASYGVMPKSGDGGGEGCSQQDE